MIVSTKIEAIDSSNVGSLAEAHAICFPGYFLTNLGEGFLQVYYRHYLESDYGFGVVALDDKGKVEAFAVGVLDLDGQDARLFRKYAGRVIWTLMTRWASDPDVRRQVTKRIRRFGKVVVRLAQGGGDKPPADAPNRDRVAYLTSIGVLPHKRGQGLAQKLTKAFEEQARALGYQEIRASTSIDNHPAVAFYRKDGWAVRSIREWENGITFSKSVALQPSQRPGPPR